MNCFTGEQVSKINQLVREIEKLNDVEKLFLYLQLPCGRVESSEASEGKQKLNGRPVSDLFSKKLDQETTQTYTWILSHLEVDSNVSLPKQEVYDDYKAFCQTNRFEPLCVADFGKAMKHAFPCIKPRRLGQRGNSRYCYSGLRKKYKIQAPELPDMIEPTFCIDNDCSQAYNQIVKDCHENPNECLLNNKPNFDCVEEKMMKIDHSSANNQLNQTHINGLLHHKVGHEGENNYNKTLNGSGSLVSSSTSSSASSSSSTSSSTQDNEGRQAQQFMPMTTSESGCQRQPPQSAVSGSTVIGPTSSSQPIASNRTYLVSSSNYASVIQPPGTPDDDDYQHNYKDIPIGMPMGKFSQHDFTNNHLYHRHHHQSAINPHQPNQHHIHHHHQNQQLNDQRMIETTTCNAMRPNSVATSTTTTGAMNQDLNMNQTNFPSHSDPNGSTNNLHLNTNNNNNNTCGNFIHLTHLSNSHIDSSASPFQSPASTPYPMASSSGGYMSTDIGQDYYSSTSYTTS